MKSDMMQLNRYDDRFLNIEERMDELRSFIIPPRSPDLTHAPGFTPSADQQATVVPTGRLGVGFEE